MHIWIDNPSGLKFQKKCALNTFLKKFRNTSANRPKIWVTTFPFRRREPMSNLNNLDIRYPHQFWFLAILRAFIPELSTKAQTGRYKINASFTSSSPITFWGDLAIYLSQREVLVEHFS